MPVSIPGFGPNANAPTPEIIERLRLLGVFPNHIRYFAGREDFARQGNFGVPWPVDGPPKYWCAPQGVNTSGVFLFLVRRDDGSYPTKVLNRSDTHAPEMRYFSQSALTFYETRNLGVPALEVRHLGTAEANRLSFPSDEVEDPMDYPIAEVFWDDGSTANHTFPGSSLILIKNGSPVHYTVEEAIAAHPVGWGPQPRDVGLASMLEVVERVCTTSSLRQRALTIKRGPGTVEQRARDLIAMIGL